MKILVFFLCFLFVTAEDSCPGTGHEEVNLMEEMNKMAEADMDIYRRIRAEFKEQEEIRDDPIKEAAWREKYEIEQLAIKKKVRNYQKKHYPPEEHLAQDFIYPIDDY